MISFDGIILSELQVNFFFFFVYIQFLIKSSVAMYRLYFKVSHFPHFDLVGNIDEATGRAMNLEMKSDLKK